MENCTDLRIKKLVENIYRLLLGEGDKISIENSSIIKVNNENLSKYGDLCFLTNLDTWRKLFPNNFTSITRCKNILQHYLLRNEIEFKNDDEFTEKAFRNIIRSSIDWCFKIDKCALRNERVCLFLNRKKTFSDSVSLILSKDISYGELDSKKNKSFLFNITYDDESELTNLRLRLIKGVAENIIKAHGYKISEDTNASRYDITTKSQRTDNRSKVLLCGVAKNPRTKTKETKITEVGYFGGKLAESLGDNGRKLTASDLPKEEENSVPKRIAEAAIAIEFLAVKPSRAITVASDLGSVNAKGSSFILYNAARISAIFDKFEEERLRGNYPNLSEIEDVDFSLLNQEEEWELTYNFLLGYPEMIETCMRLNEGLEICPQYICSFLSRLCNKFSAYYRRTRILTEGRDHLLPTMMARLYLLEAVQIVIRNALRLLNIDPVSRM